MKLAELTYPEARTRIDGGAVALWPIGSTEAHGPHLPLDTDVLIAEQTCLRAVTRIETNLGVGVLILPPLAFTVTDFLGPFAGTVSVPKATTIAYVRDVARAVAAVGFKAVCLVNAHLEPRHRFALRDAVAEAADAPCPIGLADPADKRFAATLTEEFASGSCHAGQYETSLVLAAAPDRVRPRAGLAARPIDLVEQINRGARTLADAGGVDAYCGDPAGATVEEGHRSYERLAQIVEQVVGELLSRGTP